VNVPSTPSTTSLVQPLLSGVGSGVADVVEPAWELVDVAVAVVDGVSVVVVLVAAADVVVVVVAVVAVVVDSVAVVVVVVVVGTTVVILAVVVVVAAAVVVVWFVCRTERLRRAKHAAFGSKIGTASVITSPAPNASTYGTLNVCVLLSTILTTLLLVSNKKRLQNRYVSRCLLPKSERSLIPEAFGGIVVGVGKLRAGIGAMHAIAQTKVLPHDR
jgi:hypothetical protein